MAKIIEYFGIVVCRDVKRNEAANAVSWAWREEYIGRQGELYLYESERKRPGEMFLYFCGSEWSEEMQDFDDWYLRTGFGKLSMNNSTIVFETENSTYIFEIVKVEENSDYDSMRCN